LIKLREAVQIYDTATGGTSVQRRSYFMRGNGGGGNLGTSQKGEPKNNALTFTGHYIKMFVDGRDVFEVDKFNGICSVNGVDQMAAVRDAI
jgi:P2 family phage contractile tail tube protein